MNDGQPPALPPGTPALPLPLQGLFRSLLRAGVRLGVRDYLDGLRALQGGHGGRTRAELARLAEALWARHPEEVRLVRRWFDRLPPAPVELVHAVQASWQALAPPGLAPADAAPDLPAPIPATGAPRSGQAPGSSAGADKRTEGAAAPDARARIALSGAAGDGGLGLPHLAAEPQLGEDFVLEPHPLVPARQLAVTWRRYHRPQRSGARTELDLAATLRLRCERGLVSAPVMRPPRRNTARLLVLADASPSMTPWQPFLDDLERSLALGRLGQATLRWFGNVPRRQLHASARLNDPEPCDDWLQSHAGCGLLVISDAGSVRGQLNRRRWQQTREFIDRVGATCGRLVWLNPMPRARWEGSTAERVAADPRLTMLPLDAAGLLQAVDILRGHKPAQP